MRRKVWFPPNDQLPLKYYIFRDIRYVCAAATTDEPSRPARLVYLPSGSTSVRIILRAAMCHTSPQWPMHGLVLLAYVLPGPPRPVAPLRQPERHTRASRYDYIGHFAAGPHYMWYRVSDRTELLLLYRVLSPCHGPDLPLVVKWLTLVRQEPATFPRVKCSTLSREPFRRPSISARQTGPSASHAALWPSNCLTT